MAVRITCRLGSCRAAAGLLVRFRSTGLPGHKPLTVCLQEDGVRKILLNNPEQRNALSLSMLHALQSDILHEVNDRHLRVIIIAAEGPVFSSGHNLKELTPAHGKDHHAEVFNTCAKLMTTIQSLPVPVIAQVHGLATAAGCQLVASCDVAVASDSARFATPGVNVGLFCSTPAVALGRAVPRKVALEMLLTGEPISAKDALLHGLVSKVVRAEDLETETMKIARKICQASRSVIALGKATFYKQINQTIDDAYKLTAEVMVQNLGLKDGQEGIEAFSQKRKPVWTNSSD
ncbi:enoyl-CoA hydratase domain-containing protein 3, mitochondrial [Bombina bombina]|uniref:enoyl-CoA hydratase domain-containing protein 3, mitochondrial n=1 Tax=Bombina bombina TaxID=8345 RepID=UPI00235B21FF|nr:enoyl-CoA hydratase domain-containing protein 3, mitochondrial [Bombina bombina]